MINTGSEDIDLIKYSNRELIGDIWNFLKPHKWRFFGATIFRLVSDIANLYPLYGFALAINFFSNYEAGTSLRYFWIIIDLMVLAYLIRYGLRYFAKFYGYQVAEKAAIDSQMAMIRHLSFLDISWHEKENAGNKLKRIQKGASGLDKILRMWINNFIEIGINFIGMIYILSRFDKLVGLLMIIFLVTYFLVAYFMMKRASDASQQVDIMEEEMSGLMFQVLNNIRSVKVLAIAGKIMGMIEKQTTRLLKKIKKRILYFQIRSTTLNFWMVGFKIGTIILIAYGIIEGKYEVGILVLFNGYFNSLAKSVDELAEVSQDLAVCKYGIARMQRTLDEPVMIDNESGKMRLPEDWKKIEVKNLSFAYGKSEVLKEISFEIKRGERIGIVGLSGAGKSTLFKLLLKENENFKGDILFDGLSIKKISKSSYFEQVGVVLQDTEVFNFTLKDNITISGRKNRDEKKLADALEIAHVSDFIHKLPKGLDTYIGEKGIKLSGGERQRLGIARAVYKQPKILFLDEATSHLDLESEEKIRDSLHKFFQKVTAIVIAHRLTTIRELDKILVIEQGRIVEMGSFNELYDLKGRFFELWEKQKL